MAEEQPIKYNNITIDLRMRIVKSIQDGHASKASAAKQFENPLSTIWRIWYVFSETGTEEMKQRGGFKRKE